MLYLTPICVYDTESQFLKIDFFFFFFFFWGPPPPPPPPWSPQAPTALITQQYHETFVYILVAVIVIVNVLQLHLAIGLSF